MVEYNVNEIDLYGERSRESIAPIVCNGQRPPVVLSIAGSDSSGGAGIEADLKTIASHGCYGLTAITALTAQNTTGVYGFANTEKELMYSILDTNFKDLPISSVKSGLLTCDSVGAIEKVFTEYNFQGHYVLDPVMVSTSGYEFMENTLLESVIAKLSKFITIITPNLLEAKAIVNTFSKEHAYDEKPLQNLEEMYRMCVAISKLTSISNVLIKGGHQKWADKRRSLTDVLYCAKEQKFFVFHSDMLESKDTHGTGCTLSSAIASNLSHGLSIVNSVANAILYVQNGIKTSPKLGAGNGPLNHFQNVKQVNFENSAAGSQYFLPFDDGDAFKYLCNHPEIKPLWEEYIHHPFFAKIDDLSLSLESFKLFCQQDILYLTDFAQIFSILLATNVDSKHDDFKDGIENLKLVYAELAKTKALCQRVSGNIGSGVEEEKIGKNEPCLKYTNFLLEVCHSKGDLIDIYTSLMPCMQGYHIACTNAVKNSVGRTGGTPQPKSTDAGAGSEVDADTKGFKREVYGTWMAGNLAEPAGCALEAVRQKFNQRFVKLCRSPEKLKRLVEIFKTSTVADKEFLDACV